ncbi:hypothetical protein FACS189419_01630 [Planctomycetales bacterium]|nr:hypothetical protein FACS189419_01630 [Planctomycetales bacterium]
MSDIHIIPLSGASQNFNSKARNSLSWFSEKGFFVGEENYFLEPLVQQFIDNSFQNEQLPFYFYGSFGSGRTHLLQGIYNAVKKQTGKRSEFSTGYYCTALDFVKRYKTALQSQTADSFTNLLLKTGLLLIDDLQYLSGEKNIQYVLQHILDKRTENGLLTVFAADFVPNEIFEPPLLSRLVSGTLVPLFLPGLPVRQHFLSLFVRHFRLSLSGEKINSLAAEAALPLPQLYSTAVQLFITGKAKKQLSMKKEKSPSINEITKRAAAYFGYRISDIRGKSRKKTLAGVRSIVVYLANVQYGYPFSEISVFLGNRDITTVRYLAEKVKKQLTADSVIRRQIFELSEKRK